MIQRCRQFFHALFAHPQAAEIAWARSLLSAEEMVLFSAMSPIDQCHALRVAHTAVRKAEALPENLLPEQKHFLLRLALLHDVGRKRGDLGLWGKVAMVLLDAYLPRVLHAWAKKGAQGQRGMGFHMAHIYCHHAEIGYRLLKHIGDNAEAEVIRHHHHAPQTGDSLYLKLLRAADEEN